MKVYIGKYIYFFGAYQLADLLQKVGVSEDRCYEIGKWLSKTWVGSFLEWIYRKRKRKVKVILHDYDMWNVDSTLSLIIHPLLLKFRNNIGSINCVDNEDVPEHLRTENPYSLARWEWVLDEMIWAHDPEWDDKHGFAGKVFDLDKFCELEERRKNGFRLFGKYYSGLWD